MFLETPMGRLVVMTRSYLDAFMCNCGRPDCSAQFVEIFPDCGHGEVRVVYLKAAGAIVIVCPVAGCKHGSAFRVAGEG